ncbi:MAG: hypothetical protein RR291_05100 [Clostridia bacterium]
MSLLTFTADVAPITLLSPTFSANYNSNIYCASRQNTAVAYAEIYPSLF